MFLEPFTGTSDAHILAIILLSLIRTCYIANKIQYMFTVVKLISCRMETMSAQIPFVALQDSCGIYQQN